MSPTAKRPRLSSSSQLQLGLLILGFAAVLVPLAHAWYTARALQRQAAERIATADREQRDALARTLGLRARLEVERAEVAKNHEPLLTALALGIQAVHPSLERGESPPAEALGGLIAATSRMVSSRALTAHRDAVCALAFSPDGTRLVIPPEVRRAAGFEPGMQLDVRVDDGTVVIESAATPVSMQRQGRFIVAQPSRPVPVLTEHTVQKTRERLEADTMR